MRITYLRSVLVLFDNNCNFDSHKLLGIPRSTFWSHIEDVEKKLGFRIINRSNTSKNSFTEQGLRLIPIFKKLVEDYDEGLREINTQGSLDVAGSLSISTTTAIASSWLMPSIRDFRQKYPKLIVNINALDCINKTTELSADILVRTVNEKYVDNFEIKWYLEYDHGLFASENYIKKHGIPQSPKELLDHHILAYGEQEFSGFQDINWHIRGKWSSLPRITPCLTINSTASIIKAAEEGLGICSTVIQTNSIYGLSLVRILPNINGPTVKTFFCIRDNLTKSKIIAAEAFGNYFRRYLESIHVDIFD